MGLRKWLLGFDPEEFKARLEELEFKIERTNNILDSLREELNELRNGKADIRMVKSLEEKLSQLDNLINELRSILTMKFMDKKGEKKLSMKDKCDLVLNLIKNGVNTSSELRKFVPFSVRELHQVLKRLEELSAIRHVKRGRTKYYYVIEAKGGVVRSEDFI